MINPWILTYFRNGDFKLYMHIHIHIYPSHQIDLIASVHLAYLLWSLSGVNHIPYYHATHLVYHIHYADIFIISPLSFTHIYHIDDFFFRSHLTMHCWFFFNCCSTLISDMIKDERERKIMKTLNYNLLK